MKLLLLTDVPPCADLTAGLVLAKLCRFIPEGGACCFTALNRHLDPKLFPDLAGMSLAVAQKPLEFGALSTKRPKVARVYSMVRESYRQSRYTPKLIEQAISFGKAEGVDAVLAVLQGQTMVRMAAPVARGLDADLYTLIWDPLLWWLTAHHVDRLNRDAATRNFDAAVRASKAVAAPSWAMAEHIQQRYGVRATPVIASHESRFASAPAIGFREPGVLVIGMAGQFYSQEEWWQLIVALNHAGWRVGDREVRLLVFSHERPAGPIPAERLDYRGFATQQDVMASLAIEADVLYCPYPFGSRMDEVARLSFPSKLAMYLGCGRPVLFHGPEYSSPYRYLESRCAALLCKQLDPPAVYNALTWLVEDPGLYGRLTKAGEKAFQTDFTLERMRASFFEFLGVGPESLGQVRPSAAGRAHLNALIEGARRQRESLSRANDRTSLAVGIEEVRSPGIQLQHALADSECSRKELAALNETLTAQLASSGVALNDALAERNGLFAEWQEAQRLVQAWREQNRMGMTGVETLRQDALSWRQQHDLVRARADGLEASNAVLSAQLSAVAEVGSLRDAESLASQQSLQTNFDLALADRDALQARIQTLQEQHARLVEHAQDLERLSDTQLAALLGKLSSVERQIDATRWSLLGGEAGAHDTVLRERYLDLLEGSLTGNVNRDTSISPWTKGAYDPLVRSIGRDWPATAMTMIGTARMRNLRHMTELVIREDVPGDCIETGVWRGGACIYMRGILAAYGDPSRKVWVADSFEGLPPPDEEAYPADRGDMHHTVDELRVSEEDVRGNFERYGLLDDRVVFLKGWFKDTLPRAQIDQIALLRLDGDMYSSTIEALDALYHKVSPGGVVVVDDYVLPACKEAIDDFRRSCAITSALIEIDGAAVYWRVDSGAGESRGPTPLKAAAE